MKKIFWMLGLAILASGLNSCKKDDDSKPAEVKSIFTVKADKNNGFLVHIVNQSINAKEYEWNFGDGKTGTQKDSAFTYTYANKGTFTITLTVKNGNLSDFSTNKIEVIGITLFQFLTGDNASGKVWRLAPKGGINMYSPDLSQWWYSWDNLGTYARNTIRHHQYIFKPDGSFEFKTMGYTIRPGATLTGTTTTILFASGAKEDAGWADSESWVVDGKDCKAWGNNADLTFKVTSDNKYAVCKKGRIVLEGLGGHIGPMDTGTELVVDEPSLETFYDVYSYGEGGEQPDTLVLYTPWGSNEAGVGAERTPVGIITLLCYKNDSQIPADEFDISKQYKTDDIYDDFDNTAKNIIWFKDNDPTLFDENFNNPAPDAVNSSEKVAKYVRGSQDWANVQFTLDFRMNLTARNKFKMKLYIDAAAAKKTVAVKLQDSQLGGNAWSTQAEVKDTLLEAGKWLDLTFDFSKVSTNTKYDKIVVQFGDEGAKKGDGTFYFDDFKLE
jgi:PKD repeat protein